jgi:hypothetical protein
MKKKKTEEILKKKINFEKKKTGKLGKKIKECKKNKIKI